MKLRDKIILNYIVKNRGVDNKIRILNTTFDYSDSDVIQSLSNLQARKYITYKLCSVHQNDLRLGAEIIVLEKGLIRREELFRKFFSNTYDFIKFIIPVIISVIALIISILK